MPVTLAKRIIHFYTSLQPPEFLPKDVEILFPQKNKEVMKIVQRFFNKYYSDTRPRHLIFGINPGRFGGGITGINFTGPRQLTHYCQIDHSFGDSSELSAEFIYEVIENYGGPNEFYAKFFISAVSPLGFVKNGIN